MAYVLSAASLLPEKAFGSSSLIVLLISSLNFSDFQIFISYFSDFLIFISNFHIFQIFKFSDFQNFQKFSRLNLWREHGFWFTFRTSVFSHVSIAFHNTSKISKY